jgi:hypothetical protein
MTHHLVCLLRACARSRGEYKKISFFFVKNVSQESERAKIFAFPTEQGRGVACTHRVNNVLSIERDNLTSKSQINKQTQLHSAESEGEVKEKLFLSLNQDIHLLLFLSALAQCSFHLLTIESGALERRVSEFMLYNTSMYT